MILTLKISAVEMDIYDFIDSFTSEQKVKDCVELLDSIPGITKLSAIALIAEIGDITDFKKTKQLLSLA